MSGYFLSPSAQDDLTDIADHYLDEAGPCVAGKMLSEFVEAFRFLARTPGGRSQTRGLDRSSVNLVLAHARLRHSLQMRWGGESK